jgi:hypothetical protein
MVASFILNGHKADDYASFDKLINVGWIRFGTTGPNNNLPYVVGTATIALKKVVKAMPLSDILISNIGSGEFYSGLSMYFAKKGFCQEF